MPYHDPGRYSFAGTHFFLLAVLAADGCDPNGFSLSAHTSQIMAAVAAEAFIEEFAFDLASLNRIGKGPELARVGSILQQLEESRVQVTEKFQIASQLLPGSPFHPGKEPFQSFGQLIKLRNALAHPKPVARPPRWFQYFVSKGLVVQPPHDDFVYPDWLAQLRSKRCAVWACCAIARIAQDLIQRIREPCDRMEVPGIYQRLSSVWDWTTTDSRIWP